MTDESDFTCEMCHLGKSHRSFSKKNTEAAVKPGEVTHTDVCGPMSVESIGGSRYYLTFKDVATNYRHVYFLKHKHDTYEKFKDYEKLVSNKFGRPMKILRSDNGLEFCNRKMNEYLTTYGIKKENTAPFTPQQNGKVERDNRTISESARTMIHAKNLPLSLWAEAVNTAVYILNRTVSASGVATPYEMWTGKKPNIKHLRIFGSDAFVHVPKQFTKKMDLRAKKMILVGYSGDSENYRMYDPITKQVKVSRDVTFFEQVGKTFTVQEEMEEDATVLPKSYENTNDEDACQTVDVISQNDIHQQSEKGGEDNSEVQRKATIQETPRTLRVRAEIRRPKRYEGDVAEYIVPNTYEEAINGEDTVRWGQAIEEELRTHEINHTWSIVSRTPKMETIDSKWVFKIKDDTEKGTQLYKARLCARGFMQRRGIDYTETFAPVIRYDSLRIFLAMIAREDLEMLQFDSISIWRAQRRHLHGNSEGSRPQE